MSRAPLVRLLVRALQAAFIVAVFVYGGREIARQWASSGDVLRGLDPRALPLIGATLVVFATYGLLIQLWRRVLRLWDDSLSLGDAVRIWSISSLGRYVPGRIAQIAAMAMMARDRGVSPVAATGSALINTLLNIVAGLAVAAVVGGRELLQGVQTAAAGQSAAPDTQLVLRGTGVVVVVAAIGILLLPWLLPPIARLAGRLLSRDVPIPALPARAVWLTAAGNAAAWIAYGAAFQLFALGTLGTTAGATSAYIAVYTGSYIAGYLVLLTPGGLGVREMVMVVLLQTFGLAGEPEAWVLAFASRIWLTVLEVVPGLLFLALGLLRPRRSPLTSGDASP